MKKEIHLHLKIILFFYTIKAKNSNLIKAICGSYASNGFLNFNFNSKKTVQRNIHHKYQVIDIYTLKTETKKKD